ncbi:MAG TPA: acyltransferase family protein, partial [Elusimicrobiota bacterium]|nr:acyltransferase family protein [Elusimicrobiota bacterium]
LAVLALGAGLLLADELANLGKHIAGGAAFVSNIILYKEAGYFDRAAELKPLLHLWSLGIEEQFYLTWPVLLVLAARKRWRTGTLIGALFALSFGWSLWRSSRYGSEAFYLLPSRFWELLVGCGLAYWERLRPRRDSSDAAAWLGAALFAASLLLIHGAAGYPGVWGLLPTAATALLMYAGPRAWLNRRVLSPRPAAFLGRISYPLYLWHWPLLSFARITQGQTPSPALRAAAVALSFILAWWTWARIERPLQSGPRGRLDTRRKELVFVRTGLAAAATACAAGLLILFLEGLPGRYPAYEDVRRQLVFDWKGTDGCNKQYGVQDGLWCIRTGPRHRLLVLGDSHATHLVPGILAADAAGNFPLAHLGKGNCPPLAGLERLINGQEIGCLAAFDRFLELIREYFKEDRLAVLSSQHPKELNLRSRDPDESGLAQRELYKRGLARTIRALESRGMRVILALDVPELDFDPATCLGARPLFPKDKIRAECSVARADVDASRGEYRRLVAELEDEFPRLRVFDPLPVLCDASRCRALENGRLMYRDADHLSVEGSARVGTRLIALLRELDEPL